MPPLFADTPPAPPDWLLLPLVVLLFGSNLLLLAFWLWGRKRWVGWLAERLGRRGLLGVNAAFFTTMGVGGVYVSWHRDETPAWKRAIVLAAGPFFAGFGLYTAAVAVGGRAARVNRLSRQLFENLPDVPPVPEPLPPLKVPDEEQAFLAAIAKSPSDDLPRLVYADWLDERGDIRGAYLRAEIDTHNGDPDAIARRAELWHRVDPVWANRVTRPPG